MPYFILQLLIMIGWAFCAAALAYYILDISRQITYVTLADGRRQERALPLVFRLLLPLAGNLDHITMHAWFAKSRANSEKQIVMAGFDGLLSSREFMALRILSPLVFGGLWSLGMVLFSHVEPTIKDNLSLILLLGVGLFYIHPILWLRQAIKRRHTSIQRALPFLIDLLTLSVEAGVDFMSGLQRAIERRKMDPLTEELLRMISEIRLGTSRRQALRNLAERVNMPDLRSFAYSLIQADELGISIGTILRIQSEQLRQRRFDRAERLANEAPVKLLGPLMIFIFPAVFIVLLGPILSRVAVNLM